jgi:serine/threonine protein kinase
MDSSRKVLFGMLKGNRINQYYLKELLGAGNFGGVFLADEVVRNRVIRQVAIKLIPSDGSDSQLNELTATTTLRHPHLVEAYSAGECELLGGEFIYLVLELGKYGLDKRLEKGKLSDLEARQVVTEIAEALIFLHSTNSRKKSIVHRDLKPANILRVGNVWKIADFGIAREMSNDLGTLTDRQMGSPAYTPPEGYKARRNQTQVNVSPAWDMWSLGVMTVEILTGELPFKDVGDMSQARATIPNNLPKPFDEIVRRCLIHDCTKRWSAKDVLEAITPKLVNQRVTNQLILTLPKNQKSELVSNPVQIYEFSRGFREVQINGKWVSGGFGNSIARSNYKSGLIDEIPEPIRSTVDYGSNHENLLGIPTAYNPPEGDVSLIAREIDDRYSILAVANKQDEDKYRTDIVGYRYFWLDKSYVDMDGVGTLLSWWLSNNCDSLRYVFDMNPSSFRGEQLISEEYLLDHQKYDSRVRNYPIYPAIFELQTSKLNELHELALLQAREKGIRLAWAWNVRRLEFPAMYLAIWYTNEAAKKAIELDLQRIGVKNQPIFPIIPNTSWVFQRRDRISLNLDEKKVEKFLLDFSFTPSNENARKIINLIPNSNVEWDKFFAKDNQYIKYLVNGDNPPKEVVFYAAWEPVIAPINVVVWLNWLREPQNQKYSSSFLKVHATIEKVAQKDGKQIEISNLIHEGISSLLAGLLDNQIAYENCKWLLVDKKDSLWSKEFNEYSDQLLNYLNSSSNTLTDSRPYTKKLWEDLHKNHINKFDPQTPENIRQKASHLANLFRDKFQSEVNAITTSFNQTNQSQLSVCYLSALFYQYSEGNIPSSIFVPLVKYENGSSGFEGINV